MGEYLVIKERYERKLIRLKKTLEVYKSSNNTELVTSAGSLEKEIEELTLIVRALDSQVWEKVGKGSLGRGSVGKCPRCGKSFDWANDYCKYCGKALDWRP